MSLYHFEVGFPSGFTGKVGIVPIRTTAHARNAAENDRYGKFQIPAEIDTNKALVIEAEIYGATISKIVYRVKYNDTTDLIMVCIPERGYFTLKTVWGNLASDKHKTLDRSRYTVPQKRGA